MSTNSTAQWVVEAQATIHRGAASARANPKEPIALEEATEAAMKQAGEEAPRTSETKVAEARAPEVKVADAEAPGTTEAVVVEVGATELSAQGAAVEANLGTTQAV